MMHPLFELHTLPIVIAVLLFVLLLIATLVIVDQKARMPKEKRLGESLEQMHLLSDRQLKEALEKQQKQNYALKLGQILIHMGIIDERTLNGVLARKPRFFSISGKHREQPIWAWLTAILVLWTTMSMLLLGALYGYLVSKEPAAKPHILSKLETERKAERVRHFHNLPETQPFALGKQDVCYYCHGDFAHSKKPMVRSLLNMHTQFVGCMTCHFDETKIPESTVTLRWLNYSGLNVKGKPYGIDVDSASGDLIATDDYYSKIVPYQVVNGKEQLMEVPETAPDAKEFIAIRDSISEEDRDSVKKTFHAPVNGVGRFCTRCHTSEQESLVPYRKLGFSDKRIMELTNLNIVGMVQKYREFYLPTIFNKGLSTEKQEAVLGHDGTQQQLTEDMKKDPRTWWRNMFEPPVQQQEQVNVKSPQTSTIPPK